MPNKSLYLTVRETRDLDRALKANKLSFATTARFLILDAFGIVVSKRRQSGPRAASTATVVGKLLKAIKGRAA